MRRDMLAVGLLALAVASGLLFGAAHLRLPDIPDMQDVRGFWSTVRPTPTPTPLSGQVWATVSNVTADQTSRAQPTGPEHARKDAP